jgi:OOP family OmpA-OmpF porin
MKTRKIALATAMIAFCGAAMAGDSFYVGGSLGQSSSKFKSSDYTLNIAGINESQDKTDTAYKIFAGYNILPYLAVEGGYAYLGKPAYNYAGTGIYAGFTGAATAEESSWFLAAKGTYNLNEQIGLFVKAGVAFNRYQVTGNTNNAAVNAAVGFPSSISKNTTEPLLGIGAEFNLIKQVSIRAEWESFGRFGNENDSGRTDASMWSIGVAYKF